MKNLLSACAVVSLILPFACDKKPDSPVGAITLSVGTATLQHGSVKSPAKIGMSLTEGDTIITGDDGVVVVSFGAIADAEIQPKASFTIKAFGDGIKKLYLEKGNLWLRVNRKLLKNQELQLQRLTTTAAVRGTKFYSFEFNGFYGTCECEGSIEVADAHGEEKGAQPFDHIMASKGDWVHIMTDDEMTNLTGGSMKHDHSAVANSPLGRKPGSDSAGFDKKLAALVNTLYAAEKK